MALTEKRKKKLSRWVVGTEGWKEATEEKVNTLLLDQIFTWLAVFVLAVTSDWIVAKFLFPYIKLHEGFSGLQFLVAVFSLVQVVRYSRAFSRKPKSPGDSSTSTQAH